MLILSADRIPGETVKAKVKARKPVMTAARRRQIVIERGRRRRLIEAPFNALGVRLFGRSYLWAGVLIRDTVPTEGRRSWSVTPEDEEALVHLAQEGD